MPVKLRENTAKFMGVSGRKDEGSSS